MILADSDILIDYLNGVQPIVRQVQQFIASDRLQTSAISCFELLSGVQDSERGRHTRTLIEAIPILAVDREAATQAAYVRQDLARIGRPIGMADSLIAGVALANNLPLLTHNRKHFQQIGGLTLIAAEV